MLIMRSISKSFFSFLLLLIFFIQSAGSQDNTDLSGFADVGLPTAEQTALLTGTADQGLMQGENGDASQEERSMPAVATPHRQSEEALLQSDSPDIASLRLPAKPSNQPISRDSVMAFEEFSWGVRAFHNGYYNNALVNFEKALGMVPKNALYRLWLGMANYYAGLDESAVAQWETVMSEDVAGYWLQSRIDTLLFRSSPYYDNLSNDTWAERGETVGKSGRVLRFLRPTSVVSDHRTGGAYVASYGTNSVATFDVNGALLTRYTGGLVQFDGPWDVLPLDDGRFFVTEFRGKRVSLMSRTGLRLATFGSLPHEGSLTSPQYLTSSEDGYLYVTDWASRRVIKYDFNGRYVMDIGTASSVFEGIGRPGGIAAGPTELYVVDVDNKVIRVFDHYGNYLRDLGRGELNAPEGLRLHKGKYLIIADGAQIIEGNLQNETFVPISDLTGKAEKVMQTAFDANGALLVTDNRTNRLVYLSRLSSLYGGMSVETRRIVTDRFPQVTMEVAVQSRSGQPITGLQPGNFLLYDNGLPVINFSLGALDNSANMPVQASLMIEGSPNVLEHVDLFSQGVRQLNQAMLGQGTLKTFWASESPIEDTVFTSFDDLQAYKRKATQMTSHFWRFDAGLRMSASALMPRTGKQAVFFLTTGEESGFAFQQYQPNELATYLRNNGIMFFPIYVLADQRNEFYDMIARESGAYSLYLYRPQGLAGIVETIKNASSGIYTIRYTSQEDPDFGRAYISTDLEVVLQKESGKTVSGYFAPLS
ncbi:MAG: hypothetical protein ACRCVN_03760 [Spirochaetia bacterium]